MAQPPKQDIVSEWVEALRRRRWWFAVPTVVISALTIPIVLALPATYRSSTLILVEAQKVPEEFVKPTVTTDVEDRLHSITQQVLSRTRLERVIREFGLYRPKESSAGASSGDGPDDGNAWSEAVPLGVVEQMKQQIQIVVSDGKSGNTFSIAYEGDDPDTVMHVTNRLAALFIEENLKDREEQAEGTSEFLEAELQRMKGELESQESVLSAFKQRHMGELPEQLDANLRTLDRLQMEKGTLQDALRNAEDRLTLMSASSGAPGATRSGTGEPASPLSARLQAARVKLAALLTEYKEEYPDVILARKEIESLEMELAAETTEAPTQPSAEVHVHPGDPTPQIHPGPRERETAGTAQRADQGQQVAAIKRRQEIVEAQIRLYEQHVENTPIREQQLAIILRDYENVHKAYQSLLDKRQNARIAESLERRQKGEIFRVLDPADRPSAPYRPNRPLLMLVGLGLGLGAGIGLVMLREQMDASIRTEEELISAAAGIPLLAVIPLREPGLGRRAAKPESATKKASPMARS
ncbi:MAG: GNVR domain-containing protein [Nitrospirota bacterium]